MAKADDHRTPSAQNSPLLETWQRLNRERDGAPSDMLKQMRALQERLQHWAEQPHIREIYEQLRHLQESGLPERIMGRVRPVSRPEPLVRPKRKRAPGGGRKRDLIVEEACIAILSKTDSEGMTVEAAMQTLQDAGYKIGRTTAWKLLKRAYSGSS